MHTITIAMIGMPEMIFLGAAVLLLFGGKKIPELMRSLGQGVKSFKSGMNDEEISPEEKTKIEEFEKECAKFDEERAKFEDEQRKLLMQKEAILQTPDKEKSNKLNIDE